jgi:hypothetical protein
VAGAVAVVPGAGAVDVLTLQPVSVSAAAAAVTAIRRARVEGICVITEGDKGGRIRRRIASDRHRRPTGGPGLIVGSFGTPAGFGSPWSAGAIP